MWKWCILECVKEKILRVLYCVYEKVVLLFIGLSIEFLKEFLVILLCDLNFMMFFYVR